MYSQHYISAGEQTKMYTLRHQFEETVWFRGEGGQPASAVIMRDYYIQNLSTDADKAVENAEKLGYKVAKPKFTLDEIKRRTEEELAQQREEARQAAYEREQEYLTTQKMKLDHEIKLISEGKFPFGRNAERNIKELAEDKGNGWIEYWMKQGRLSEGSVQLLGKYLESNYKQIAKITFMNKDGNGKFFGVVKEKMTEVSALHVHSGGYTGRFGFVNIEEFITDSGELLVYMGSANIDSQKGDNVKLNFTVKEHSDYQGVNQTKIIRVKVIS